MLYTIKQLRQIEQVALASLESGALMQAAGQVAARTALKLLKPNQPVLVLAGPGNNGGDALETSVHLGNAGHQVAVLHHPPSHAASTEYECALNKARACSGLTWLDSDVFLKNSFPLVIDGLFGIGLKPQGMSAISQRQIEQINILQRRGNVMFPTLALDVPSGLDADTGNLISPVAVRASHTITFIGDKPGLHTGHGRDYAGAVEVADLGIAARFFCQSQMQLNHMALFSNLLQPRQHHSNKGSFGTVLIVGGATGMQGAVILAGRAALHSGAGRVLLGFIDSPPAFDMLHPELMCRLAEQVSLQDATAVVIGPGLGQSTAGAKLVQCALQEAPALVLDADALNIMAAQPELIALCQRRQPQTTLLTPHPLEAARLLKCTVEEIQADRIASAKQLAKQYAAIIILKGSGSIMAHPDGDIVINTTGNPALATAGTGDVLAGVCGAFAAQHHDLWRTALAATWVHGVAADNLVTKRIGPVGLCAGELTVEIRNVVNAKTHG